MVSELSCGNLTKCLEELCADLEGQDPDKVKWSLRMAIAQSLFLFHDEIRCREAPFDRQGFANRLEHVAAAVARAESVSVSTRKAQNRPGYERYIADLYSRCWAKYTDREFVDTMTFFGERFRLNNVSIDSLRDAECVDAGCGSGRYALAMIEAGAYRSVGVDISDRAITEAEERSTRLGYAESVEFVQGSVTDLPAEWENRFDFACSNGVIHHTPDPLAALQELYRVLKPGGQAFIMVYGTGGLFWALVDFARTILSPVPLEYADAWLEMTGTSAGKLFFCLDHWYTPYQERVTRDELECRLRDTGFGDLQYLPRARIYDSSERLHRYPDEEDLIGHPDPRYLVRKPR